MSTTPDDDNFGVEDKRFEEEGNSSAFALHSAYPNPFNPFTNLSFTITEAAGDVNFVTIKIFNILGQLVRSYEDLEIKNGTTTITWDGKDNFGDDVSSGVYFYRLITGEFTQTKKMILLR